MFGFRSNSIKKRAHNSKSPQSHEKSSNKTSQNGGSPSNESSLSHEKGSSKTRQSRGSPLNLFGPARPIPSQVVNPPKESPPPPEAAKSHQHYEYKYNDDDSSSVDMSLYTTVSKATVRYAPPLLNYKQGEDIHGGEEDSSNNGCSRDASEFTSEVVFNRHFHLGGSWNPPSQSTISPNPSFESSSEDDDARRYSNLQLQASSSTPTTDPTSGVPSEDGYPAHGDEEAFDADENDENDDESAYPRLPYTVKMAKLLMKDAQSRTPSPKGKLSLRKQGQEPNEQGEAAHSEPLPTSHRVEQLVVHVGLSAHSNTQDFPSKNAKVETKVSTPIKSEASDGPLSDLTGLVPPSTTEKPEPTYTFVVSATPAETPGPVEKAEGNASSEYATPETAGGSRTDADSLGYSASCSSHSKMSHTISPQDTPSVRDDDTYGFSVASCSVAGQSHATGSTSPSKRSHQPHRTRLFKQWDNNSYGHSTSSTLSKAQLIQQRTPLQVKNKLEDEDSMEISVASATWRPFPKDNVSPQKKQEIVSESCQISQDDELAQSMMQPPSTGVPDDLVNHFEDIKLAEQNSISEDTYGFSAAPDVSSSVSPPVNTDKDFFQTNTIHGFNDAASATMPAVEEDESTIEDEAALVQKAIAQARKDLQRYRNKKEEKDSHNTVGGAAAATRSSNRVMGSPREPITPPALIDQDDGGISVLSALTPAIVEHLDDDTYGFSVKSPAPHLGQADSDVVNLANVTSPIIREQSDRNIVWTENDDMSADKGNTIRRSMDSEVRKVVDETFQQTMESFGTLKIVEEERCPSPDVEWDEDDSDFTGAILLTSKELDKHLKKVQNINPFPSSSIEGYDSWRRQNECKRRYFAKLQANTKERQKHRRSSSDFHQPYSGQISSLETDHRHYMYNFNHPYHASSDPGVGTEMSTRTPMERSMDSTIPTLEDSGEPKPRKQKGIPRRRSGWNWFRGSKKKITKKSGKSTSKSSQKLLLPKQRAEKSRTNKKVKKDQEPEIVSLSHFMSVSANESLDVEELSLAPLNNCGPLTIGDSTVPSDTFAAPKSPCIRHKQLAQRHLEEERAKQLQAEADKDLEERLEWERIARRKQEAIEQQRRMNLPQENSVGQQPPLSAPMNQPRPKPGQYGRSCRDWKHLAKKSSFSGIDLKSSQPKDQMLNRNVTKSSKQSLDSSARPPSGKILSPCVICNSEERTHIAMPCMHFYFCETCVDAIHQASDCPACPVCSTENVAFTRVFTG